MITEQEKTFSELTRIVDIFKNSLCEIRPHLILTGASGSGKSYIAEMLAEAADVNFLEINAAQLTKEGTAGNSLSKALAPLAAHQSQPTICFVDEFDKLFISGNSNSDLAHETTNGVQNEFLKVLESNQAAIYGDFGKYINIGISNVLFIFAGAFNGEDNITIDRLREMGIKTEFLGRVGLIYNIEKASLDSLFTILENSTILESYLKLFTDTKKKDVIDTLKPHISEAYEKNTLGVRLITTLLHQYFIKGGVLSDEDIKQTSFQKTMTLH